MNIGRHVDVFGYESIHMLVSHVQPENHPAPGVSDKGKPQGGPPAPYGDGCRKHQDNPGLAPNLVKESWNRMREWYKEAANRALLPAQLIIKWVMAYLVTLYHHHRW